MDYFWKEEEFITGDNLESLGDYIFDVENYITGDHGRIKTDKTEQQLIAEQIVTINEKKPNIIYCYGHDTLKLLNNIDNIDYKFKLLTHNSDLGILPEYQRFIENEKIIKWFGQNNYLHHSKVTSVPIGIARQKYPHGNTKLLSEISKNNNQKINLVYKNFSINTNFNDRALVNNITNSNGIYMNSNCDQYEYLANISKSVFVISPPGNGIDCHRIWECLYLNTIPIVKYHYTLEQFKDLPILFVDDWNTVTPKWLISKSDLLNKFDKKFDKLHYNFWKNIILK